MQKNYLSELPHNSIPILDRGFVGLVDSMGDDRSIVQAARVSYGEGTKTVREDEKLIDYLYKHRHTTPFEMVELKFIARMPIFVARQWVRHRTASLNEYSGRYSEMPSDMYLPPLERIQTQDGKNKQASSGEQVNSGAAAQAIMQAAFKESYRKYESLVELGVARELARIVLPVANYTEWYWKCNLHNLFNFLRLRMDSHAQYEIRMYANAMYELIKPIVPLACTAFERYQFQCVNIDNIDEGAE